MENTERDFTESFQEIALNGPVVFIHWLIDEGTQMVDQITPNIKRIYGYTPEEVISGSVPLLTIIFEEDRKKFQDTLKLRIASNSPFWESFYRIYAKNGDIRFIKSYTYIKFHAFTSKTSIYSYLIDQTENDKEINMHVSLEQRWATAIDSAKDGVWDWDLKENIIFYSKHWKSMIGYKEHELLNELFEWRKRIHPLDIDKVDIIFNAHIYNNSSFIECEYRLLHADGTHRWILNRGKAVERNENGLAMRMIGTHVDITERKAIELMLKERNEELEHLVEQLKDLSNTDPLTSLCNRRKMIEEIKNAQNQFDLNKQQFTLAILDIDYFKNINDQYGHTFGDIALQTFANLLMRQISSPDVMGRWGGEEFILLFHNKSALETFHQLMSIQAGCNDLLKYRMEQVHLTFSAGLYEYNNYELLEDIIKYADQAMYRAKSLGRQQIIIHNKGLPVM
ncbi:sensor domain-containing diguanylate cyclase [Paenisporosarcina sp. TG20]|uniref:sensor domain-containing diguanylate cyclase n=1 Tax=Paenisporosarcina sp. TG20 TaxID=1211706 RepID=UPI0002E198D9|nr:diguanylate cyclase [Paenisporosarcina sp. TG20]